MRISDWSSDVCSSDLIRAAPGPRVQSWAESWKGIFRSRLAVSAGGGAGPDSGRLRFAQRTHAGAGGATIHRRGAADHRSEEHTSELQSLMRISYAVFCLKKKKTDYSIPTTGYN